MSPPFNSFAASKAYRQADVKTSSQKDLILRLYAGLERFLSTAQTAMQNRQIEAAHRHSEKAKDILTELLYTLNIEAGGEIAAQLRDLYVFLIAQVCEANLRKEPAIIDGILPIIATLADGWRQVPEEHANLTSVPVSNQGHAVNFRS
jgi:flagellar secretion chaperone FliS